METCGGLFFSFRIRWTLDLIILDTKIPSYVCWCFPFIQELYYLQVFLGLLSFLFLLTCFVLLHLSCYNFTSVRGIETTHHWTNVVVVVVTSTHLSTRNFRFLSCHDYNLPKKWNRKVFEGWIWSIYLHVDRKNAKPLLVPASQIWRFSVFNHFKLNKQNI